MPLTDEQLRWVRARVSDKTPPTDDDLNDLFDELGDTSSVVKEVLQKRLAELTAKPASFSIPGDYSENNAANIAALKEQLADNTLTGVVSTVSVIHASRRSSR